MNLVKSSEKTQKVELVREDESKNDESKKDKLVKSSEKTQKVELVNPKSRACKRR